MDCPPLHLCPSLHWQWRLWHPHLGCYGRAAPSQVDPHIFFLATFLFGRVRATANAIVICMGFILGFVMSKTFVDLINAIHARYSCYLLVISSFLTFMNIDSGTFWLYGGVCLVGTFYTIFFVPETKGKTIEEIQQMFSSSSEERRKGSAVSRA